MNKKGITFLIFIFLLSFSNFAQSKAYDNSNIITIDKDSLINYFNIFENDTCKVVSFTIGAIVNNYERQELSNNNKLTPKMISLINKDLKNNQIYIINIKASMKNT